MLPLIHFQALTSWQLLLDRLLPTLKTVVLSPTSSSPLTLSDISSDSSFNICISPSKYLATEFRQLSQTKWEAVFAEEPLRMAQANPLFWDRLSSLSTSFSLILTHSIISHEKKETWSVLKCIAPGTFESEEDLETWEKDPANTYEREQNEERRKEEKEKEKK